MDWFLNQIRRTPSEEAVVVRTGEIKIQHHAVLGTNIKPPYPKDSEVILFGMGCFWGAERVFGGVPGVFTTAVGYAGGYTPNPTYDEVCSGATAHAEVVRVVYYPKAVSVRKLLKTFFENHDPTQGMRQGLDVGTQYRSLIGTYTDEQQSEATKILNEYAKKLKEAGYGEVSTEILQKPEFYFAEESHQQYLHKNPFGYCTLQGTGVACPIGLGIDSSMP